MENVVTKKGGNIVKQKQYYIVLKTGGERPKKKWCAIAIENWAENAEHKMGGKMPKLKQYDMDVENGREKF